MKQYDVTLYLLVEAEDADAARNVACDVLEEAALHGAVQSWDIENIEETSTSEV